MSRLREIVSSYRCYERRVLLDLAALRNGAAGILAAWLMLVRQDQGWPAWAIVVCVPCDALFVAWVSADFVERQFRLLAFGRRDHPWISARLELEGAMTPEDRRHEPTWRNRMYRPQWPDDPGSGRYDVIPTFWGRVRALFTGAG